MGHLLVEQLALEELDLEDSEIEEMSGAQLVEKLIEIYKVFFRTNNAWTIYTTSTKDVEFEGSYTLDTEGNITLLSFEQYLETQLNSDKKVIIYKCICFIFYISSRYYDSIRAWVIDKNRKDSITFGGDILEPEMLFATMIFLVFNVLKRHALLHYHVITPDIQPHLEHIDILYRDYNTDFGKSRTNKTDGALIRENIYSTRNNYPVEFELMVLRFVEPFEKIGIDICELLNIPSSKITTEH